MGLTSSQVILRMLLHKPQSISKALENKGLRSEMMLPPQGVRIDSEWTATHLEAVIAHHAD